MNSKRRITLIYGLNNLLLQQFYKHQEIMQLKAMGKLALENQNKTNGNYPCFMFEGVWYTYPYNAEMPKNTEGIPRSLDINLIHKAIAIMYQNDFEETISIEYIRNFIGNALNLCRTINCLEELLSIDIKQITTTLHTGELEEIYNIGNPLTKEEINQFKQKNVAGIKAVQQLTMKELLLARDNN